MMLGHLAPSSSRIRSRARSYSLSVPGWPVVATARCGCREPGATAVAPASNAKAVASAPNVRIVHATKCGLSQAPPLRQMGLDPRCLLWDWARHASKALHTMGKVCRAVTQPVSNARPEGRNEAAPYGA
jgi:hypothetical protein